ncbi:MULTISPECIES: FAD-binding dehydrogenase [Micrococcaceae]|uniref:Fumarate/succinate/L-aspartate dehydrogenases n=1 Tax=Arthrobacter rhombi TaxID=71253 RepID=A0A1R4FDS9_9MICC|nr:MULTISPECIES: FAD-binding dehydrogenase [Micrococcaceae]PCC24576.1 FAD-binding dehydrogenase [Glutamicibacter sp. BW78]SJM54084.1 Fumarate/succinate/L-aspartate dehydrogenases [Arthrobacter rhombi]
MTEHNEREFDVIVVGAGLSGLVAATEATDAGRRVLLIDQEPPSNLGAQAWWSFGGLFLVDSPEQRRLGIRDSVELARQDWWGTAGFDRPEDYWPRQWAEAYVDWAAGGKRAWLHGLGVRFFPVVGWAERGGHGASGPGNSVPRFHITWGTGPGIVEPFANKALAAVTSGLLTVRFRHRLDELVVRDGVVTGVQGRLLAASTTPRGQASNREEVGDFEYLASAVVLCTGGIGGNVEKVREAWPERLGAPPERMISGVPAHVDGRGLDIGAAAGGHLINGDRMWHYTEGIVNHGPVWQNHGIRILPGPSSLWLDATGRRLPAPLWPGFDTLGTLEHLRGTGHDHSWFILNRRIIGKEFALSGSEQNPDLTGKDIGAVLRRARTAVPDPVQAFLDRGEDFIQADTVSELVAQMNRLEGGDLLDAESIEAEIVARDAETGNRFSKDPQQMAVQAARSYLGDKLIRTVAPHRLLDPKAGPLIAVRLHILTRKSLGGLETDLDSRVLAPGGHPIPGLYAAGEAAGFGGGGVHGYRALEGTFLGGCLFSGRAAGRAAARR